MKSNRQYLKNQQTVLSAPDSPCQTVLKFPELHARQFWIFSAFHSPLGVRQPWSWNFDLFFIEKWFCDTQNTFHLIVRGFKNAFFMPFTHSLFQKYPSYMRVSCAISEISIHYESGLWHFRNIHPLWERLVLFQKYPSTMRAACAISEIVIHYDSSLCYFRNTHPLWDEQQ